MTSAQAYADDGSVHEPTHLSVVPTEAAAGASLDRDREKVLPLPGWLTKLYFIFPVVLYIPDAVFNAYVYSDGWDTSGASPLVQVGKVALVSVLALGVVGMAYLLSVLAPWHWGQGHHIQAFFCAVGVVIATAVTIWNSLAYRSGSFVEFKTDQWAYNLWPDLASSRISVTMILVSIAPPFWGLFWAIVQPTATGRSLRQLQESHQEKLLRVQHEAEVKRLKAEANAKVREAQLKGMARTAAAAREQAAEVLRRKKAGEDEAERAQAEPLTTDPPTPPAPAIPAPRTGRIHTGAIDLSAVAQVAAASSPVAVPTTPTRATKRPGGASGRGAPPTTGTSTTGTSSVGAGNTSDRRGNLSHVQQPDSALRTARVQRAPTSDLPRLADTTEH